jgi:hypothetical protein
VLVFTRVIQTSLFIGVYSLALGMIPPQLQEKSSNYHLIIQISRAGRYLQDMVIMLDVIYKGTLVLIR